MQVSMLRGKEVKDEIKKFMKKKEGD